VDTARSRKYEAGRRSGVPCGCAQASAVFARIGGHVSEAELFSGITTPINCTAVKIPKTLGEQQITVQVFSDYPAGEAPRAMFFAIFDKPLDGRR
jgi:hypothetical protein